MTRPLLLIGCGYTLRHLARRVAGTRPLVASTRNPETAGELRALGAEVVEDPVALAQRADGAHVVVSLPPEAGLDDALSAALLQHRPERLVYLSSTGVYGAASGRVDEATPVDQHGPSASRVRAERLYQRAGAVVLRPAGIYGPERGLHERLRQGAFRLPGDGSRRTSRIHVEDLCSAIEVALTRASPGDVFNVADDQPAPLREVVSWLCARLGVPIPPSIPLEQAPATLRGDRTVANERLRRLGWAPRFPSYVEGFSAVIPD